MNYEPRVAMLIVNDAIRGEKRYKERGLSARYLRRYLRLGWMMFKPTKSGL